MIRSFALVVFAAIAIVYLGCAASEDTKIGYGGPEWSAREIFHSGLQLELGLAIANHDEERFSRAVEAGAKVQYSNEDRITPLWWAVWCMNMDAVKSLLELGADPNVAPHHAPPVMHLAAEARWDIEYLGELLKAKSDPNIIDHLKRRPIDVAVIQGTPAHVDALIRAGSQLDGDGRNLSPVVFTAIMARRFDYVLKFLELGIDARQRDRRGRSIAEYIAMFPYDPNSDQFIWRERAIRLLRSRGISVAPPGNEGRRTKPWPRDLL